MKKEIDARIRRLQIKNTLGINDPGVQMYYNSAMAFKNNPKNFLCLNVVRFINKPPAHSFIDKYRIRMKVVNVNGILQNKGNFGIWEIAYLQSNDPDPEAINAYYCKYNDDRAKKCYLDPASTDTKFFITDSMDGCTLAIGGQTSQRGLMVMHLNIRPDAKNIIDKEEKDRGHQLSDFDKNQIKKENDEKTPNERKLVQRSLQKSVAKEKFNEDMYFIEPNDYMKFRQPETDDPNKQTRLRAVLASNTAARVVTTFGVLEGGSWKFYTHRYDIMSLAPLTIKLDGTYIHGPGPGTSRNTTEQEVWELDIKEIEEKNSNSSI